MNIETYKTDVTTKEEAKFVVALLQFVISDCIMNFDVEDKNHVLTIETNREIKDMVYGVFNKQGFYCQKL
ncbi:hypothetical protein CFS9_40400 [Flavobacterium sp. CFS9]|uniref:Uncharacterized protein n=3 Tax=Flavobacterium TaxID=237 RepID=A0A1S1J2D2_9FLAO|nr:MULTISPECIES: hypothetical protein [Flavobacterium]MCC9019734.1 hypothetical protein [Flavobacterium sp. F-126]MDL2142555.1 hypothetical protein [Flavobacterium tructae]OHT43938.1 hypothetical protein BHE19_16510 [Flavobacterium tructae]OXB21547.1 hypothetical protein B0A71_03310 [Flavobacterium tructae]OXB25320.1 hypothetical protein B0A80_01420 [Flavobacterium tructae]